MFRLSFKHLSTLLLTLFCLQQGLFAQEAGSGEFHFNGPVFYENTNPCKVFIGVGTSTTEGGLKVDYTVPNTPATTYGVQTGDIILSIDGTTVRTQSELIRERDKHTAGDNFTLAIRRNGQDMTVAAKFKACSAEEKEQAAKQMAEKNMFKGLDALKDLNYNYNFQYTNVERDPCKVFIGVETSTTEQGLKVDRTIANTPAAISGVQNGDIILALDGASVRTQGDLLRERDKHAAGDKFTLNILREGKPMTISAQFKACSAEEKEQAAKQKAEEMKFFREFDSFKSFRITNVDRDPCKVFIGVYTSPNAYNGKGARVDGVIDETPAKLSGIQSGDIIIEFNGVAINNHQELTRERDKCKPGEAFTLTVMRDDKSVKVRARFKACETPEKPKVTELTEINEEREAPKTGNPVLQPRLEAFPNPTSGPVNVRFEAEAVPTVVSIYDAAGREVYHNELPQFNGVFAEEVNLSNEKAGNFTISVRQGDMIQSKQVVLLPRA